MANGSFSHSERPQKEGIDFGKAMAGHAQNVANASTIGRENRQTEATGPVPVAMGKGACSRSESQLMQVLKLQSQLMQATSQLQDEEEVRQPASSSRCHQGHQEEQAPLHGLFSKELARSLLAEGIKTLDDLQLLSQTDLDDFLNRGCGSLTLGDKRDLRAAVQELQERGAKRQRSSSDQHPPCADSEASRAPPSAPPVHVHVNVHPEMQQKPVPKPPPYPPPSRLIEGEDTERCTIEEIEVDQLFYSQWSIKPHFKCGRTLDSLVDALKRGEVRLTDEFLTLEVVEWKMWDQGGKTMRLFSTDNRRLYCLKDYKKWLEQPVRVKCRVMTYEAFRRLRCNAEHFDTINNGTSIEIRRW